MKAEIYNGKACLAVALWVNCCFLFAERSAQLDQRRCTTLTTFYNDKAAPCGAMLVYWPHCKTFISLFSLSQASHDLRTDVVYCGEGPSYICYKVSAVYSIHLRGRYDIPKYNWNTYRLSAVGDIIAGVLCLYERCGLMVYGTCIGFAYCRQDYKNITVTVCEIESDGMEPSPLSRFVPKPFLTRGALLRSNWRMSVSIRQLTLSCWLSPALPNTLIY